MSRRTDTVSSSVDARASVAGESDSGRRSRRRDGRHGGFDAAYAQGVQIDGGVLDHSAHGGGSGGHGGHGDDGHDHDAHATHFTLRDYVTGFFLAVLLTAIPFWFVMGKTFSSPTITAAVILGFAAVQIVVHMIYFLHMSPKSEGGWNLLALLFTVMLVVIALSGSLWVMYHLNHNMMPDSMMNMHNMP